MSYSNWEDKREHLFTNIKSAIDVWIMSDIHNVYWDSDTIWTNGVYTTLNDGLIQIGMNEDESNNISEFIIKGIEGFLQGIEEQFGLFIEDTPFTPDILSKIIYKNITWQLGDGSHSPSFLDELEEHYVDNI